MKRQLILTFFLLLTIISRSAIGQHEEFLKRTHTNLKITSTIMPYRLFVPANYDANKAYPLVLMLHGAGAVGTDNELQLTTTEGAILWSLPANQSKYPCFVVAPQCGTNQKWVNTEWTKGSYIQDKIAITSQLSMVIDILDSIQREFNINSSKIYVNGNSMGGYGTWEIITRFPKKFAAAIAICGAGDPSKANLIGNMPLRVFHGELDPTVPVSGSRDMVNAINALGPNDRGAFYTEYAGGLHGVWVQAWQTPDLVDWLFNSKSLIYTPATGIQTQSISANIYAQDGNIIADLSTVTGNNRISVFDIKGSIIHVIQSKGSELLKINMINRGVYIVFVQSGNEKYIQKVVL